MTAPPLGDSTEFASRVSSGDVTDPGHSVHSRAGCSALRCGPILLSWAYARRTARWKRASASRC